MCCKCEAVEDVNVEYEQRGKRVHSFWQDPVIKFIDYLRMPIPFADTFCAILHNSGGYDEQFLFRSFGI